MLKQGISSRPKDAFQSNNLIIILRYHLLYSRPTVLELFIEVLGYNRTVTVVIVFCYDAWSFFPALQF